MSGFSDYLDSYMEENSITSVELSKETNIDRTTVFRYRKGTRIPTDEEMVGKLARGLRMSVREKEKLFEEYDRLILGETTVNCFFYIKDLLRKIKNESSIPMTLHADILIQELNQQPVWQIQSSNDILSLISVLFVYARDEDKEVCLVMQPIYEPVNQLLKSVFQGSSTRIGQIICLEQSLQKNYLNLEVFRSILSLCFEQMNYQPRYYYDYLAHHINPMSWMPNIIIVGEYVLEFDYEMETGILIHNEQFTTSMNAEYHKMQKNTEPFLIRDEDQMFVLNIYSKTKSETCFCLFMEPCFGMAISSDIFEKYLYPFPEKQMFIQQMAALNGDWNDMAYMPSASSQINKVLCNKDCIREFMETGRVREFPEGFYEALPMEVRKMVLNRVIHLIREEKLVYYFLSEEFMVPQNIYFYWQEEKKMVEVHQVTPHAICQLVVNEPGVYQAFRSFYEYLEQKHMLTPKEEVIGFLEQVKEEYK